MLAQHDQLLPFKSNDQIEYISNYITTLCASNIAELEATELAMQYALNKLM